MIRRARSPALVGALVLAVAGAPRWVGLYSGRGVGDMVVYRSYADLMTHEGLFPYRDFFFDWAPGSVLPVLLPGLPGGHYYDWFHLFAYLYGVCAVAAVAATLVALGVRGARLYLAVAAAAAAPAALGAISVNSLDLWPALFAGAGLAALAAGRDRLGLGLLGAGIAAKLYPVVIVPLVIVSLWRRRGRAEALRGLLVCAAVTVAASAPFALLGPRGLFYTTRLQLTRGLQMESLGASLLMALDRLGLHHVHVVVDNAPYSLDVPGGLATAASLLSTLAVAGALLAVYAAYAAGRDDPQRLVTAGAAAVAAYVAFGHVLSPQYLVWLIPLVPLVAGVEGVAAGALLFAAAGLTMTWFPGRFADLQAVSPVAWCVLARNLVLVLLFLVVAAAVWRTRGTRSET